MKKFIVIYHAPNAVVEQMAKATPEEKAKGMEPWMQWKASVGDMVLDFGAPVGPGQSISTAGAWGASTKEVTGYSILQAEDLEAAKKALVGHPHIAWAPGCSIDVHEFVAM